MATTSPGMIGDGHIIYEQGNHNPLVGGSNPSAATISGFRVNERSRRDVGYRWFGLAQATNRNGPAFLRRASLCLKGANLCQEGK